MAKVENNIPDSRDLRHSGGAVGDDWRSDCLKEAQGTDDCLHSAPISQG